MSSRCKSCGAQILWAVTGDAGRAMPLDAEPTEQGNIILKDGKAIVVKEGDKTEGELFHLSHFATCANAKRHRKPGGKKIEDTGRTCPFDGCGKSIPAALFACYSHWFKLRSAQRATVNTAYGDYLSGTIGVEELRTIQQGVLDEVQS